MVSALPQLGSSTYNYAPISPPASFPCIPNLKLNKTSSVGARLEVVLS